MGEIWGLVLAAGRGERFGGAKQFTELDGVSLVERSLTLARSVCDRICLVVPADHTWGRSAVDAVVAGGATHAESTRAGCAELPASAATVLVTAPSHPLATVETAEAVLRARSDADAVAPVLPVADAVRRLDEGDHDPTMSGEYGLVQLPFALDAALLALAVATTGDFAEEFSLVERAGGRVATVPGDPANLHVTTRSDLVVASEILAGRARRKSREEGAKS